MSSTSVDVERKARRMEDHLTPALGRAVRHLADISGWSVRNVMLAMLANAVGEQAVLRADGVLAHMFHECVRELLNGELAEQDPEYWLARPQEDGDG